MHLKERIKRLSSCGDTIVEVLIAITVISTVLGVAYVTANRSLQNSQRNQERSEALKHAETQLERLKISNYTGPALTYCVFDSGSGLDVEPIADIDDLSGYHPNCVAGTDEIFRIAVERDGLSNDYTVWVRWNKLGSGEHDQVSLLYRKL